MRNCFVMLSGMLIVALAAFGAAAGCGKEIGDPCTFSTDCSPNGDRTCDVSSFEGYCTIPGCDVNTCPDEAVCVQFFNGDFENQACEPAKAGAECAASPLPEGCCSLDELCSVAGRCVPRSSEIRFCMRTCGSDGDCREGYECRDLTDMINHGGEPVLQPGTAVTEATAPRFCASAPPGSF
jgi:hypothetical protein